MVLSGYTFAHGQPEPVSALSGACIAGQHLYIGISGSAENP